MKKLLRVTVCILLIAVLFCACGANFDPVAGPFAREMMTALEANDVKAATELMHPDAVEQIDNFQKSMENLCEFVDGRGTTELKQESVNITNRAGTNSGKYETGTFSAVLDDGTVLEIEYTYLVSSAGSGFTSFYLSIGT